MEPSFQLFARIVGIAYVLAGVAGAIWPGHWDDAPAADQILWVVFLVGGGMLILAGLRLFARSPSVGAVLISLGAVAGAWCCSGRSSCSRRPSR